MSTLQESTRQRPEKEPRHLNQERKLWFPSVAAKADEVLAEARRRDAEIESGKVKPLTEDEFWASVRRRA